MVQIGGDNKKYQQEDTKDLVSPKIFEWDIQIIHEKNKVAQKLSTMGLWNAKNPVSPSLIWSTVNYCY